MQSQNPRCQGQDYTKDPDYAYNHALFTNDMRIYSDSKVSDFLHEVTVDQRIQDLVFWHEGLPDEKFMTGAEKTDVINREIRFCGYFAIVTSEKMTAKEALELYKSRDVSEKTFRGDKSYLGAGSERVCSNESIDTKIFIGFVATINRSRIYTLLKDEMGRIELHDCPGGGKGA